MPVKNLKDRSCVALGMVHNIGAGGVIFQGRIRLTGVSRKRLDQFAHRAYRATGGTR